jgi:MFS family permease
MVPEPELFLKSQARARRGSVFDIFGADLLPTTLLSCCLAIGCQGGYYAITTFLPTFLRTQRHLTVMGTGGYLAVIIVGSFCGYIVSAYLNDRIGRRPNLFIFAIGSTVIALGYTQFDISDGLMLVLGFPLGFFASGIFSGLGPIFTELFPTPVRATGQGFCYNFGRGIGAFFPTLVGALSVQTGLGVAIGLFAAGAYTIVILAAVILPETRGRELKAA